MTVALPCLVLIVGSHPTASATCTSRSPGCSSDFATTASKKRTSWKPSTRNPATTAEDQAASGKAGTANTATEAEPMITDQNSQDHLPEGSV